MLLSSQSALENFLPLLVGFWIALKSVTAVVTAVEWKKRSYPAWKVLMAGGIAGILLALLIAAVPKIVSVYIKKGFIKIYDQKDFYNEFIEKINLHS